MLSTSSRLTLLAFALASLSGLGPAASAQGIPPATPVLKPGLYTSCPELTVALVDPITGVDPSPPTAQNLVDRLNDLRKPFRTLQLAIDAAQYGTCLVYLNPSIPDHLQARGLVLCMPGLYGPTGVQSGPKDSLPILVRDRVSIQGQGARRTILRGGGAGASSVFWPNAATCGTFVTTQVLVNFSSEHDFIDNPYFGDLPWKGNGNSEEMLDGFTLQGGGVQVYSFAEEPRLGRISNCIFDMRDGAGGAAGPTFGILLAHKWDIVIEDYWDMPFNVFNNTFVLGEDTPSSVTPLLAHVDAVAICDVNYPICGNPFGDPNTGLRGVGSPSVQNNLLRSVPGQNTTFALLGIDASDVTTLVGTNPGPTNAFHQSRTGGTNGFFFSAAASAPVPKANLDVPANDPPFIGEALAPSLAGFQHYRDWRLVPGSSGAVNAMQNAGSAPNASGQLVAANGTQYTTPACDELDSFDWDGEVHGNPRRIAEVDIGFDEIQLMAMAGTWANDTNNHNNPDPVIDPNGGQGGSRRFLFFPSTFVGGTLTANGTLNSYNFIPPIPSWLSQPGTLAVPQLDSTLPVGFQTQYISFANPPPTPTPWTGAIIPATLTNPVNGLAYPIGVKIQVDVEGTGPAKYFNLQGVVSLSGTTYRGNLQSEYR